MYKLNFYPEFFERRAAARKTVLGIALASVAVGFAALLLTIQLTSNYLLDEKVQALNESVPRLSAGLQEDSESSPELKRARALMELRGRRVDWAPKLAALAERIDRSLIFLSIEAHSADKTTPTQLEISGEIRRGSDQLAAVSEFIRALQADPRISGDLPSVRLGNLREGSASQFLLICESQGGREK